MRQKKKLILTGAAVISVSMLCVIFTLAYCWREHCQARDRSYDIKKQDSESELVLDDSKKTLIKIYTPEEQYTALGSVEITRNGVHGSETVLELRGSIYSAGTTKYKGENQKETARKDQLTILRVYTAEDEIYSFCSQKEISSNIINDRNQIEFHGYLEGYSNGEQEGY